MPSNLIPCCRDCNSDKSNAFAGSKGEQPLHPYFDDKKYFFEQWVYAEVLADDPPSLRFYVSPPDHWTPEEKERVRSHFQDYGLGARFGVEAAADLPETIQSRKTTLCDISPADFSTYLSEKSTTLGFPINNWRRVMFASLVASEWFCAADL